MRHRFIKSTGLSSIANVTFLTLLVFFTFSRMARPLPANITLPLSWQVCTEADTDQLVIFITKDRRIFLGYDLPWKGPLLDSVGRPYGITFTEAQHEQIRKTQYLGTDIRQLPATSHYNQQPGIPIDIDNNQLKTWITAIRKDHPHTRIRLYADKDVSYDHLKKVLNTLNDLKIFRLGLIVDGSRIS